MNEAATQRYLGRASGLTSNCEMTREERKLANELRLFEKQEARHQGRFPTAEQDDGPDEIEDWVQCNRCKKWRKLRVSAVPHANSAPVTESISGADIAAGLQEASGSISFECKMAGDLTCDTPEDTSWVRRPAFDRYEEAPTLQLCLSGLEEFAFKIPEEGYVHEVGVDMQGSMVKDIRETPDQSVQEVGDMLKRVVSHIDERFMKKRWTRAGGLLQAWEKEIDGATDADKIFDLGIEIERKGIDWARLQTLREETQSLKRLAMIEPHVTRAVVGSQDKDYIGRIVKKEFLGFGIYFGKVIASCEKGKERLYRIAYADGDEENVSLAELHPLLQPVSNGNGADSSPPGTVHMTRPAHLHTTTQAHAAAAVKVSLSHETFGDSSERANRVQRVEALLRALEKAGIVRLEHASAQEMKMSKMAVSIRDIYILDKDRWVLEMNKALDGDKNAKRTGGQNKGQKHSGDGERSSCHSPKKLLGEVRESFRYLGILPVKRLEDGRLDWESQHFAFDVNVRNARLDRAVNYGRSKKRGGQEHVTRSTIAEVRQALPSDPRKCNSRCKGKDLEEREVGESTKRRAAMLEYSRDEVRAGEALQQIYDYFRIATEQLARAECCGHDAAAGAGEAAAASGDQAGAAANCANATRSVGLSEEESKGGASEEESNGRESEEDSEGAESEAASPPCSTWEEWKKRVTRGVTRACPQAD